jgi:hypothetical protein
MLALAVKSSGMSGREKLVLDFRRTRSLGAAMDDASELHELAEGLVLQAGALSETLATNTARIRADELDGETGERLVQTGQSIALLLEAAQALARVRERQ